MPIPGAPDFSQMSADVLYKLKQELDAFIEQSGQQHLEMDQEDSQVLRQIVQFRSCPEETYVIVIAVHKDPRKNQVTRIKCHKGTQIGGYAYDMVNDSYVLECIDHFALGLVPISFQVAIGSWFTPIPMPEGILLKYLNDKQKANLAAYKANFTPKEDFTFEFVQLLH